MDPQDPPEYDATGQNRRQFMRRTGAASIAAAVGVSGQATAMTDDGEFETDPYSLGVASGDPLPTAVVIWTRLAPDPRTADGAMPDEAVDVEWTVANDESMSDVVKRGTATADPSSAHTVHVDVRDLDPNTEYYYQFEARGKASPVGRTKTAPSPDASPEEFNFAFASCQRWVDGYYTAYEHMAEEELDLVVHLGDYIYEYGIGANGGARDESVPTQYREEITTLDDYRLRYGLYKSDPDLKDAHASAPWLVTRDDHEVDNNWAGDVPEDDQSTEAFRQRRAAALQAYYEHMPFRMAQKPDGPDQKLYRNFSFGDLVEFNVLDTRHYRDDQACGDVGAAVGCDERFERQILGDAQREWLLDNLQNSTATWDVLANQLPIARVDRVEGEEEGYRTDQWDGYVPSQEAVFGAFEEHVDNPVVVTGDVHSHWANEIRSFDDPARPIGTEFVGTSIASNGDGRETTEFGQMVLAENDNVVYHSAKRGYVRCRITPDQWQTDYRVVDYVTERGAPVRTDARFVVDEGQPGLQGQTTVAPTPTTMANGDSAAAELVARWLPDGLAGGKVTVSVADPSVAGIDDVTVADAFGAQTVSVAEDGSEATIRFVDLEDEIQTVGSDGEVTLAAVALSGTGAGGTDLDVAVDRLSDDDGADVPTAAESGPVYVGPPAVGGTPPTDPDGDGLYEDVNGNGRLDYDDVVAFFEDLESDPIASYPNAYDFNQNGDIDYDDVVALYREMN